VDASPAQRRFVFALVVFVLVALGAYLLRPVAAGVSRSGSRPGRGTSATASPSATGPSSQRPSSRPAPSRQADIYQWLPFTQQSLTAAAATVVRFADAYGTFSYTEDAAAYVRPMQSVVSPSLAGQIAAAYTAPGVATVRASSKQVSSGVAAIESIRAFGPDSLTFVVQITERLADVTGRSQHSTAYAVTLTSSGASWQVSAIELATTGNS
jgi:hypothetical protein